MDSRAGTLIVSAGRGFLPPDGLDYTRRSVLAIGRNEMGLRN